MLEELRMEVSRADMLEECEEPSGEPQTEQVCLTIVQLVVPTGALFAIFFTQPHATVQYHNSNYGSLPACVQHEQLTKLNAT